MRNPQFLGQVAISPAAGFGGSPWGFGSSPYGWNYANSQGGTLMTEQINSPSHAYEERHCYRSPAGEYVSIPLGQRESYLAAGYVVVDTANCGGAGLSGRRHLGADPAPAPAPSPAPSPTPVIQPFFVPDYYPYPYPTYPYAYPPRSAYDAQAQFPVPQPAPTPTPAPTTGVPTAIYAVGAGALLLGAIALITR